MKPTHDEGLTPVTVSDLYMAAVLDELREMKQLLAAAKVQPSAPAVENVKEPAKRR